jgi:hypothetical protein
MQNVTLLAVKYAALLIIEKNETTTTLEVKDLLRDLGYFAEQDEVSHFMNEAAQELPLDFIPGKYRSYKLPEVSAVSVSTVPDAAADDGICGAGMDDDDDDDDDNDILATMKIAPIIDGVSQALYDAAEVKYQGRFGELVLMYDAPATIQNLGGKVTRISKGGGRSFYFTQLVRRDLARSAHASTLGIHKNLTCSSVADGAFGILL